MTYMTDGRQHIVVAFGSGTETGLMALRLR